MTQDTRNLDAMSADRLTDFHPDIMDPVDAGWQQMTIESLREAVTDYLTFRSHRDLITLIASV